jgi:hypothetical protein
LPIKRGEASHARPILIGPPFHGRAVRLPQLWLVLLLGPSVVRTNFVVGCMPVAWCYVTRRVQARELLIKLLLRKDSLSAEQMREIADFNDKFNEFEEVPVTQTLSP